MNLNGRFVTNWTDLQLACECFQTSIHVLAQAGVTASLELEKSALLSGTIAVNGTYTPPVPPKTTAPETLALFKIDIGRWDAVECILMYKDGTYKEISK